MKFTKISLITLLTVFGLSSCKKKHSDDPQPVKTNPIATPNIYVAGSLGNHNGGEDAVFWKNGTLTRLASPGNVSYANAIAVSGNDIYLAGSSLVSGSTKVVYWKNGVSTILDDGCAYGIAISGSDIYVVGYKYFSDPINPYSIAAIWKNGVVTLLPNPVAPPSEYASSIAYAVTLQGNDVYIAGIGQNSPGGGLSIALYWKNGTASTLTNYYPSGGLLNASSSATAVTTDGTDIYIAGNSGAYSGTMSSFTTITGPIYWKNTKAVALANGADYSIATAITVYQSNVYVAGQGIDSKGFYWKNNTAYALQNNYAATITSSATLHPTGIAVNDTTIYVSGYSSIYDTQKSNNPVYPVYWKNGVEYMLTTTYGGYATAVILVNNR